MNEQLRWSEEIHYCKKKTWRRLCPSSIDDINNKISITKVVNTLGFHITWKNKSIVCPFHNERTASCNIVEEKWKFFCKWCWYNWSIITFVQEYLRKDFIQSAIWLQRKFLPDYRLKFVNMYREIPREELDQEIYQEQVEIYGEELTEEQLNNKIIEENSTIDEYIEFCKSEQGRILDINFYTQYQWSFYSDNDYDFVNNFDEIEQQYDELYWKTEAEIEADIQKEQQCLKTIEKLSKSLRIKLLHQERIEEIYEESTYKVSWIDDIKIWSCAKCIITYNRELKKFQFHFWKKFIEFKDGIENLDHLFSVIDDTNKMIKSWWWYHNMIDFEDWRIIGGWSYYMWDWVIVISGRSWDYGAMDKEVIKRCFAEINIEVIYGENYNFSQIKINI